MNDPHEDLSAGVDLRNYFQVLLRRRWIVLSVCVITVLATALYVYTTVPVFQATALLLIEKERATQTYGEGTMVETTADDYYQTQYKLLISRSLLRKVYERLQLDKLTEFSEGVEALNDSVTVSPVRRSRLVEVSARSKDPEQAMEIANTLAATYVQDNIESKLYISKDILAALFSESSKKENAQENPIALDALPAVVNSPLIQKFKADYALLETKLGELSKRYTAEHPERVRLSSQMDALKTRIDSETEKIVRGMKAELSGKLLGNNVRIIDPAELPTSPFKPRKRRALVLAGLIGLIVGYVLALAVDLLDQTLHTQEDVERSLGLPFLGSIPMASLKTDSAEAYGELLKGPKSFTGESLKNIRTMIGFSAAGSQMKSLLVTSTGQGEGKTFITMSLAMVFSHLGERVLLIEGDLRRPSLHKRFRLSKEKGLSHFLAHGKSPDELTDLIQNPGLENLDVLVCGQLPPNPSELLSTPRLEALIHWAKRKYDRILVDGTPIFPITDAILWSRFCDASIFVVKFGATNGNLASKAVAKLREGGPKIAGAIVNQVTAKANSYYGDYYYYYYHSDYTDSPDAGA